MLGYQGLLRRNRCEAEQLAQRRQWDRQVGFDGEPPGLHHLLVSWLH